MNLTTISFTTSMTLAALTLTAEASSFRREDATIGAQANRAEVVVVAGVAAIRGLGEHDRELTLQVERTLKGERRVTLTFVADDHTTLTPKVRVGTRALFFLSRRARAAASSCRGCPTREVDEHAGEVDTTGRLILDRGPRSAIDLRDPAASHAVALAEAHLAADRDPAGLLSELVQAVSRAPRALATDSALELLRRVEGGARLTGAQAQALVAAFEQRRDRLADKAPLIRLLGRAAPAQAREVLLRSVGDADGFDPAALAEALSRAPGADAVLADNLARNTSRRIRARAARLLGRIGGRESALERAATWDVEERVRGEALLALTRRGGAAATRAASAAFADAERGLLERKAAAVALAALGAVRPVLESDGATELGRFVRRLRRSPSLARHELLGTLRR